MSVFDRKLNAEIRAALVKDYLDGEKLKIIAHRYGCSETWVCACVRRAGYKLRRNYCVRLAA